MNWLNLILLLMLLAGHVQLVVAAINRVHSLRVGCRTLRCFRILHDVLVITVPPAVIWFAGFRGPRLLLDGSWTALSPGWAAYFAVCTAGMTGGFVAMIRWGTRRLPALQLSNHTELVDVAERLGYPPLADGPLKLLTKVPGNQMFEVDVSDKVYRLPRVPAEWDGLSILHLTDLHFSGTVDRPFFEEIVRMGQDMEPDLILFTGDLLDNPACLEWVPHTLGRLQAPLGCYFVLGNHDWYLDDAAIRRSLVECGWHDLSGTTQTVEHRGHPLVLAGTELPWMGRHPDFTPTDPDAFRLLLSHTPDQFPWARQQSVDLMLAGHNHGGQVVLPVIGPVYSPSRTGVRYAAGPFWEPPTLLYVSRGLSAKHPVRWRCRPELTRLVLSSPDTPQ